jgi:hypothetical protein
MVLIGIVGDKWHVGAELTSLSTGLNNQMAILLLSLQL